MHEAVFSWSPCAVCPQAGVRTDGFLNTAARQPAVRTKAVMLDAPPLAQSDFLAVVQPPSEVAMAFVVSPQSLMAVPGCLGSLDADLLNSAPSLVGSGADEARMEAAACLASPMVLEESAAEILWASTQEAEVLQEAAVRAR
jgi:hypothetical protein